MAQLGSNINEDQTRKCRSTSFTVAVTSTTESPGILLQHSDYYAELVDHLLKGYTDALYSDCILHVEFSDNRSSSYALHSLIVSRSPLLRQYLETLFESTCSSSSTTTKPTLNLSIPSRYKSIDSNSFSIVIASLYSPKVLIHLTKENCKAMLSTCYYLRLKYLWKTSLEFCKETLRNFVRVPNLRDDFLLDWIQFIDQEFTPFDHVDDDDDDDDDETITCSLKSILLNRLIESSNQLMKRGGGGGRSTELIDLLMPLPFDWFKSIIENEKFQFDSEMDRFNFAKKVINARKKYFHSLESSSYPSTVTSTSTNTSISSFSSSSPPPLPPPHSSPSSSNLPRFPGGEPTHEKKSKSSRVFDEAVVLGFGTAANSRVGGEKTTTTTGRGMLYSSSQVIVLKKLRKPILWKIGPPLRSSM